MLDEFWSWMDLDQASEHLRIFSASSAPKALVMLYMTPDIDGMNRFLADEAILHFLGLNKTILPKHAYHQYFLIIFEF